MEFDRTGKYKKYTLVLLIVTVTALVVCCAALVFKRDARRALEAYASYYSPKQDTSQENSEKPAASSPAPAAAPTPGKTAKEEDETYLVTVYKGRIGVFAAGSAEPFLTADIQVYLLPAEDRELLKKGIRVQGLKEVKAFLEDYE